MLSCNTLNLNDNIVYMEGYMLCYTFVDSVIWFKRVYIRRVLHKIWQSIPKFATQIEKNYFCIYLCAQLEDKRSLNQLLWCQRRFSP